MDELFLRFGDLPLHPLAVHFAVVLLPLSAIVFIVAVCWPKFRSKFLVSSLVGLGVSVPAVYISSQSGKAFQEVVGDPGVHAQLGDSMMALSIGMFAVAFVYWFAVRKDLAKPVIYALSFIGISVSIAVIVMIALIGHSGAAASWSSVLG
jgi:uncharacterized membrane protein